jgi:hypothetical protein
MQCTLDRTHCCSSSAELLLLHVGCNKPVTLLTAHSDTGTNARATTTTAAVHRTLHCTTDGPEPRAY